MYRAVSYTHDSTVKRILRRLLRQVVLEAKGVAFDRLAAQSAVSYVNQLYASPTTATLEQWSAVARELHAYFGEIDRTALTGDQLRDEIAHCPNGLVLLHQRISEQCG